MTGAPIRIGFIGLGAMARWHLRSVLGRDDTEIAAVCEPSAIAWDAALAEFTGASITPPRNEPDWERFVARWVPCLDAVWIATPHALHFHQAVACLDAGAHVLLEKPMVMTVDEALALIRARDRTGRRVVVTFQGSHSTGLQEIRRRLRAGELGTLQGISATVWQNWKAVTMGSWRQDPAQSGGGFLFDTGAHMLNTVADIADEDVSSIAAWLEDDGTPVDVRAVVMARLASGALVSMHACGTAIPSCSSEIRVFTSGAIIRTGVWGETVELQPAGSTRARRLRVPDLSIWEQYLGTRAGTRSNACPPEAGLRMARAWDAIRDSAARGGLVIEMTAGPRHRSASEVEVA